MNENVYKKPESDLSYNIDTPIEYAGFWIRVLASIVDTVLMMIIIIPLMLILYGQIYLESSSMSSGALGFLLNYAFPAIAIIVFWIYKSATPGKLLVGVKIVNARTLQKASAGQLIGRYFAYYISMLPLMIGFLWVAFDGRKQGLHDKIAGTLVIKDKGR